MTENPGRPNLLFIMSDDHAAHAVSAYGSRINDTPNIDRIATGGMRFDACFCTNSICTPSRAAILTGTYNHVNGVTTLYTPMDNRLPTYVSALHDSGYQTALFGKWHLGHGPGHDPVGFDDWRVLPDQGAYHDPVMVGPSGEERLTGYVTDLITDLCIDWLDQRDPSQPFALMCHHKAPHRSWEPDARHAQLYVDDDIPEPDTLWDDHASRAMVVQSARMGLLDLDPILDLKAAVPAGLTAEQEVRWRYQRYIKDYLRVVASIDDNVGRLLDWLDEHDLAEDTIVVYTSDQGFFLGDHGWFDKRFMYEESLAMPLLIRYPREVPGGSVCRDIVLNVDFAPTFCDLAQAGIPEHMQGSSFVPLLHGITPHEWQQSMYYRYWMHRDPIHDVPAHYGVRTHEHKLICFYNDPLDQPGANGSAEPVEWELYDLTRDPAEMTNVAEDPAFADVRAALTEELARLQRQVRDHTGR